MRNVWEDVGAGHQRADDTCERAPANPGVPRIRFPPDDLGHLRQLQRRDRQEVPFVAAGCLTRVTFEASSAPEAELVDRLSGLAVDHLVERYETAALRHFAVRLADLDPETRRRLAALADDSE